MVCTFRFAPVAWALLATLVLSTASWAQPGPDRGPSKGGPPSGGPGMFGGPGAGSLSSQYGRLLNSPTVQKELGITESQKDEIKKASEKSRVDMRELFSGMRNLKQDQRRAKMAEIGQKMQARAEEMTKAYQAILQPSQLQRLRGIAMQVAGTQAFADKQVQQDLKLSEDQILEVNLIHENTGKQMRDLFTTRGDRESMRAKIDEIRKTTEKEVLDELTAEQKASLEQLKGVKVDIPMSELFPSPPGRGGPPGGPPPNGPPPDDRRGRRPDSSNDR